MRTCGRISTIPAVITEAFVALGAFVAGAMFRFTADRTLLDGRGSTLDTRTKRVSLLAVYCCLRINRHHFATLIPCSRPAPSARG